MKLLLIGTIFGFFVLSVVTEEIRLLDLPPEEASQYIAKQDQTLRYAPKIESNVPALRYLGKEQHQVSEDIYLANQYHGQDGLGGYLYGYAVPDIAKTEKKIAGGDLRGAYNYINGDGQEIKVEYWDDGNGFHQTDNVAEIAPKQVEDSPEVKAAKDEFFRRWHEEAERNSKAAPDPYANQYEQSQSSYQAQYQPQPQQVQPQPQHQQQYQAQQQQRQYQTQPQYQAQQTQPQYQQHQAQPQYQAQQTQPQSQYKAQFATQQQQHGQQYQPPKQNVDYSGQYTENQQTYSQGPAAKQHQEDEEEQGPPRGFFYNFDYPVGIIVNKDGAKTIQKRTVQELYQKNKEAFEQQLHGEVKTSGSAQSGYHYVA